MLLVATLFRIASDHRIPLILAFDLCYTYLETLSTKQIHEAERRGRTEGAFGLLSKSPKE